MRTPPAVSLYHRFDAPVFTQVLHRLQGEQVVVLPRTDAQREELAKAGGFIVPEQAIDAPSLVAYADLVISAGGTMNREAVALGTPVWTTFEGRLGAVDERLIADGRMLRLTRAEDVVLKRREGGESATHARASRPGTVHRPVREGRLGAGLRAGPPNRLPRMRRRLRSAAFPIHRHALPQLALDAGLVALAYYLAYRLRFDGGIPDYYSDLMWRTMAFAVVGSLVCFAGVGMYRHWMRYSSQREYVKIAEGVVLAVLALIGYVAVVQPQLIPTGTRLRRAARSRPACWCSSGCCWARS